MTIECIGSPFTYRWPTGEVRLIPGHPVELPDGRAVRLLDKAPGRVRVVQLAPRPGGDRTGQIVTWDSPLFGMLSATVMEDLRDGVLVFHPLTERDCVIPKTWLRFSPFSPFSLFFPDKS
jgi:hypothetical protein